jgi:lipopolysaccharide export system protein LptA
MEQGMSLCGATRMTPRAVLLSLLMAITLTFGAFSSLAGAQSVEAFGQLADQSGQPVEITADRFEIREDEKSATFTGNVIIKQAQFRLLASEVVVRFGAGGQSELKTVTTRGKVRVEFTGQVAVADQGVLDVPTKVFRLVGNVSVTGAGGVITGEELVIDIGAGTSKFSGGSRGGRVTGTFSPAS